MPAHVPVVPVHVLAAVDKKNKMKFISKFLSVDNEGEVKTPTHGLHHFQWNHGEQKSRIHLRIDADDSGLLMINANRVFHLNPSATYMAYYALHHTPPHRAATQLARKFDFDKKALHQDYVNYEQSLVDLIDERACPICDLEIETTLPFSSTPSAPYRMDLALTYRCNNACSHCYNARPRSFPELSAEEWHKIIDHLWDLGIPHIVFTGGEPTLRNDLPDLIRHAEKNGQITGLNTNGRKLADPSFVESLVDAGLDHVQITLESHNPEIHDKMVVTPGAWQETIKGIRNALASKLYVMTNTTMLTHNHHSLEETLKFLADLGVPTVGLNALIYSGRGKTVGTGLSEKDLEPLLDLAKASTAANNQRLIWYTPTQYCNFDPVEFGLGVKGCTAALYNMCIEPDGSVLPCQSYYHSLGKIQETDWDTIWNNDLCLRLRSRQNLPEKCSDCAIQLQCGGGCPLTFEN